VLLFTSLRLVGCSGPQISREYDYYEDVTSVRAGPFYLGAWNYVRLDIVVPLMKKASPDAPRSPPELIIMNFPRWTFDEVYFVIREEVIHCRRPGFQEYTVHMQPDKFAKLASSGYVAGYFDDRKMKFRLDREQLEVLRALAEEIGVLEPEK
jgi:hypothetical protein